MKNFTLIAIGLLLANSGIGQTTTGKKPAQVRPEQYKAATLVPQTLTGLEKMEPAKQITHTDNPIGQTQTVREYTETIIGTTFYDLQTNNAISDRLIYNSGTGTVSAIWTMSPDAGAGAPNRGTGYNFFNGTAWDEAPSQKIETQRTGFPNIGITSNGAENVIAHNTTSGVMQQTFRATTGSGTWSESLTALENDAILGNLWSKTATNGNNLHVISLTTPVANGGALYNNIDGMPMYYRSTDGGTTWDKTNVELQDITAENYVAFSGDACQIDANGNTVAIVVGGSFANDVLLYKSTDNGDTWSKTIVYKHPYFKFTDDTITDTNHDGTPDSMRTSDGTFALLIDNDGMVHLWWGDMFILNDIAGDAAYSYYFTNALMYWNETKTEPTMIENLGALDLDGSGILEFNDVGTFAFKGLASYPSAGIDANGNIYLSYMALVENSSDGDGKSVRHVYVSASTDGGESWADPIDVVSDEFSEGAYGAMARTVDDHVRLIYQRDFCAGISTTSGNPDPCNVGQENEIIYIELPVLDLGINVGVQNVQDASANLSVYPNPSNGLTTLDFRNKAQQNASVTVTNSIGRVMLTLNEVQVVNGKAQIDLSGMENGIYYLQVKSDKNNSTLPVTICNN